MSFKDKPKGKGGAAPRSKPPVRDRKAKPAAASVAETGAATAPAEPERISKLLARAGIASRRDVERMIAEGRVRLNGKVLDTPAINATFADAIEVDGEAVNGIERTRLWLYHKPAGLVTTNRDPEGRPTVFEQLPKALPRVMSIGRLDINTEGLLLLTNDGGLARVLELPTTGWLRRYRVRAHGDISQEKLDTLKDGIAVEGVLYGGIEATLDRQQGANVWITMGLREGKNREIKNVLGALGLDVNRLIRISYGPFQLQDLPEGQVVEVRGRMLRDQLGPRLIEEAGADFDAPIVHQTDGADEADDSRQKAGAKPKPFGEKPAERNERLRGRLDTKREAPAWSKDESRSRDASRSKDGPRGKDGPRSKDGPRGKDAAGKDGPRKPATPQVRRSSNVWIAPGARPMGPKRAAEKEDADRRQAERDAKRETRGDRAGGRPRREGGDAGARPTRGAKPAFAGSDRARSDAPRDGERPRRDERTRRADRPEGSGAARGPASRGPGARGASARTEGGRSPSSGEGRPRSQGRSAPGSASEKPAGRGPRPAGGPGKPAGAGRSFGEKPGAGGRPSVGRPAGANKARDGKPRDGKPGGTKPGGKPRDGKPGGGPRGAGGSKGPGNADRRR
jgi:23S rRNA pseudouridine2605 synthase